MKHPFKADILTASGKRVCAICGGVESASLHLNQNPYSGQPSVRLEHLDTATFTPCIVYPLEPVAVLLVIEGPRSTFALPLSQRALGEILTVLKTQGEA